MLIGVSITIFLQMECDEFLIEKCPKNLIVDKAQLFSFSAQKYNIFSVGLQTPNPSPAKKLSNLV